MKHLLKKNKLTIRGAGGGGGGGAPAPPGPVAVQMYPAVLAPPLMGQTSYISSFSYAEIVDLISDGPIEGLINQDNKKVYGQDIFEGIFLNGVPVKETSRINSEQLYIDFLKKELKDFWELNEGGDPKFLYKSSPSQKIIANTDPLLTNNPFFSGPISITSYHPEDSLFQLVNSLNLNIDSIKLAERAFDVISINDERPFLTIINIPTFTVPIADFKFDKSFFGLTDKTYGLDLEITNIGQYIYFTVDAENLNSNQYSEIPRTFIKYGAYSQPTVLKNNAAPLSGYSAQKFDNVNIYIWSIYGRDGIKDVSKAIDRYFNIITIRQRLPGLYNYNLIKSEFKNGAEIQYPLQNFKNVEIDIQYDKELIGPFKIKNNQKVTSALSSAGGGVTRLTNLTNVEQNAPVITLLDENESSDDVRYLKNWPIEYDSAGNPLIISNINFNYGVFDKTSQNRVEQPAIPVTHYIDNNNVEEVYVSLTLNNLSDTNHIDLVSPGFGTKPGYTEEPYAGTLTYQQLLNQNNLTNTAVKILERYIVGVNISSFILWSQIFPNGIKGNNNISESQYPFVEKFANEVNKFAVDNNTTSFPSKVILFGVNLHYLQSANFVVNNAILMQDLNSLLEKYYLYNNVDFQTFLSDFDGGKLIGYSKIVDLTIPYEEYSLESAKTTFVYDQTKTLNVFANSTYSEYGNAIYLAKESFKSASSFDFVFKYKLTPKEINTTLSALQSASTTDLTQTNFTRKQQITAGTKLPSVVSIRIDTGYETNESNSYASVCDFFSYRFDIYGLANDPSKIDIGRRGYDFLRGTLSQINPKAGVYSVTKADSIVQFHLFKVTEFGKSPNYYISNTRNLNYGSVNFANLNPFCCSVENISASTSGQLRVYYPIPEGFEGDIETCFSGSYDNVLICGSGDSYVCQACVLDENGMFGLQTSGYLSLANFETKMILDGGLKISEVLKNAIFEDYKLNMSIAIEELKKLNYLNFSSYSLPYNYAEASYSINPFTNCYGIDTYKFNNTCANTCVQIYSFDADVYNIFANNLKSATPKTSYSFSIFRINGDVFPAQAALNKLNYKYVILDINLYEKYLLVHLPVASTDETIKILTAITESVPANETIKKQTILQVMARLSSQDIYRSCTVPNDILNDSNTFSEVINEIATESQFCSNGTFGDNCWLFRENSIEEINESYNVTYTSYNYCHGCENLILQEIKDRTCYRYITKNSLTSLKDCERSVSKFFETSYEQDAADITPFNNSNALLELKSFLLSISSDQNIAEINSVMNFFKNIKWIARSNVITKSDIRLAEYSFCVDPTKCCTSTNPPTICKINCQYLSQPLTQSIYNNDQGRFIFSLNSINENVLRSSNICCLKFEVGASDVFTVPSVARDAISTSNADNAISLTAKFWILYNQTTQTVHVVFPEFTKLNQWKELENELAVRSLPINDLINNVGNIDFFGVSVARPKDFITNQGLQSSNLITVPIGEYSNGYNMISVNGTLETVTNVIKSAPGTPGDYYGNYYIRYYRAGDKVASDGIVSKVYNRLYFNDGEGDYAYSERANGDSYKGIQYAVYDFKSNFTTTSINDPTKNIKIIGKAKLPNQTVLDVALELLKSPLLTENAIPSDAIFSSNIVSPKFSKTWNLADNLQVVVGSETGGGGYDNYGNYYGGDTTYYYGNVSTNKSQNVSFSYYEILLTNYSLTKSNIYSNDAGQAILLPAPKLDSSGSPIRRFVKITKLSYETLSPLISKRISVATVTEIIPQTFSYPFSAIVGTKIDARSFSQMPSRSFHCKLKKVLVPSNYYPNNPIDESDVRYDVTQIGLHKIYDGDWDGTFKLMWTDNPAWILMDMLVNKRYGLGNHIAPEQIDIWELYQIARWCDGVNDDGYYYGVPDSYGGVEPRHAFNALIGDKFNVFDMINQIASVFRGHVYYMNSLITFDDDRPKPPIGEFTNTDVKDGLFNYANMKKDDEFTVVEVAFVDAKNDYKSSIEYVENADAIRKRGILKKQMNAFGVTSRGQARRIGKHFLHQSSKENLNVSFTTDMKALLYKPGDLITIHDELINCHKNFGSIKAIEEVPNSGDLFKVVIDQALNSGIYDTGIITLYSAMTKPKYTDMENYLLNSAKYEKINIDFLQPLVSNLQKFGQEIRNVDPKSFAIKNGESANQNYQYGKTYNYLDYIIRIADELNGIDGVGFSINGERISPQADVGFGCLAAPNDYIFPPFLSSISGKTIAKPCRVFGKDCLFVLMNSGRDYISAMTESNITFPNYALSGISYITYPCSDMETYTSKISGLPVYVETGNKIKNEICLLTGSKVELCRSNDFLFTGSVQFKYYVYETITHITGKHQLCDYTKPNVATNETKYQSSLKYLFDSGDLNYYSQSQGFIISAPNSTWANLARRGFSVVDPIKSYNLMSNTFEIKEHNPLIAQRNQFYDIYERYTVSNLPCLPQDCKIFFPALMYFCVSENKTSYYLDGLIEKTGYLPVNLRYVENNTFTEQSQFQGHWSVSVGNNCQDILELDWVGNESEKAQSNIYEILNNINCFAFYKFSGMVGEQSIRCNPIKFNKNENPYVGTYYCCRNFYAEPFEQRSGTYSGFNNLYLFSQMTGVDFCLNYPKNYVPKSAERIRGITPPLVKESLNQTYLSGLREILCQCFNLGKPYYPVYNTGTIPYVSIGYLELTSIICNPVTRITGFSEANKCVAKLIPKTVQNLILDNLQNFTPRMIVDFTGWNRYVDGTILRINKENPTKCNYSFFQRNFAYFYNELITTGNFSSLNLVLNKYNDICNFLYFCTYDSPPFAGTPRPWPYAFTITSTQPFYSYVCCTRGNEFTLGAYAVPSEKSISYSKIIENDRPSVEAFCIYSYATGHNQASGFDESVSINTYTEIYLCKTNQFGITKDSVRNGLSNFCIGSLYSVQILNKTAPIFKVMSITENYVNEYNIFATQYKEEKFLEIEENIQVDSLDNTFNALYYYQSASRLTQKNEPLKSPIIQSLQKITYTNTATLEIIWVPASEHIKDYTKYRIYVQSPSKQTPNLQVVVGDEAYDDLNRNFKYYYQGNGIINPLAKEIGNYTVSIEAFYEKDGVYVFSTPTKRSVNVLNY